MTTLRTGLLGLLVVTGFGCSHAPGKVMGDTMMFDGTQKKWVPLIEYKTPDIDELTGIDSEAEPATSAEPPPAATPAPAAEATPPAQPPAQTPPAKGTAAAPAGKTTTPPPAKK